MPGDEGIPASELGAFLDGAVAEDECTDDPEITTDAPDFFPVGDTVWSSPPPMTTATKPHDGNVTVEDTTPPDVFPPDPITLECNVRGIDVTDPTSSVLDEATQRTPVMEKFQTSSTMPRSVPVRCPPAPNHVTFDATDVPAI